MAARLAARALDPSNPVQMAWMNSDLHSSGLAAVIPTELYDPTNDELATVAATNAGMPNPVCLQHLVSTFYFARSQLAGKYILFCKITINLVQISDDCSSS